MDKYNLGLMQLSAIFISNVQVQLVVYFILSGFADKL